MLLRYACWLRKQWIRDWAHYENLLASIERKMTTSFDQRFFEMLVLETKWITFELLERRAFASLASEWCRYHLRSNDFEWLRRWDLLDCNKDYDLRKKDESEAFSSQIIDKLHLRDLRFTRALWILTKRSSTLAISCQQMYEIINILKELIICDDNYDVERHDDVWEEKEKC